MITRVPSIPVARRVVAAVLVALVVALASHLATILAVFVANNFAAGVLSSANGYFLPSTLVSFIIVLALAALGGFAAWYLALATGVAGGLLGAVLGTTISVAQTGTPITGEIMGQVFGTLSSINLVFLVFTVIAAVSLGTSVWKKALTARLPWMPVTDRRIAIVRLPASNLAEGEVTHISRSIVDAERADDQWDAYVEALSDNGWTIVEVAPAPDMADSVFVEDAVVVFGRTAVITSPGAESRRGETEDVERTMRELGLGIERIALPGTLDGGDVLKVGSTVYVGRGGRTNAEGIRQLRAIVAGLGFTVVAVPTTKVLHLKSAVTALPDGTVIGYVPNVDDASIFYRFLAVPEEAGSHVVVLAPDTVLMAASAPRSAELISELGYRVVTVDISEFEKLEGCVTCLSVRVR